MMGMMNGGAMMFNMILWVLLLGFAFYGLFQLIEKGFNKKKESTQQDDSGLKILQERYARGDLTDEEYEHKKSVLLAESEDHR